MRPATLQLRFVKASVRDLMRPRGAGHLRMAARDGAGCRRTAGEARGGSGLAILTRDERGTGQPRGRGGLDVLATVSARQPAAWPGVHRRCPRLSCSWGMRCFECPG